MKHIKDKKGITIIELVVAMAIFVTVITLAVGGFISLVRLQSQAETMTDVQQNGRIALEQISRLSRQAAKLKIDEGDPTLHKITFDDSICFKIVAGALRKYDTPGCTEPGFTLTSSDVSITNFSFIKEPGIPSRLKIKMVLESNAETGQGGGRDSITLETSVLLTGLK